MRSNGESSWSTHGNLKSKSPLLPQATDDPPPFPHGEFGEFDELQKNFRAVQEENFKLQAVITDVTEVNKRWQKYNNDRQLYVQRLLCTIQDQQEQMNKIVEDRVLQSKEQLCAGGEGSGGEVAEDRPLLEVLLLERQTLRADLERLERALETARREHREHVEVLEFQLKAHRDDWEAERSEKQQALRDKDAAEKRVRELQRDLRALRTKYREEKLQNITHCRCCEAHVSEGDQCNIFLPGSQANMCRRNNAKTYRTSVHVPCSSSPLLPRGTTIFFSDDLVVDGENKEDAKVTEITDVVGKLECDDEENQCHRKQDESLPSVNAKDTALEEFRLDTPEYRDVPNSTSLMDVSLSRSNVESFNIVEKEPEPRRRSSTAELNLELDIGSSKSPRSFVNISPSTSNSSIEVVPRNNVVENDNLAASGVTIGFDSTGLASVMGFSRVPITKSSSLPEKKELKKEGTNPLVSRWSFDSYYSAFPIARPPTSPNFGTSMDSLFQEEKRNILPTAFESKDTILPKRSHKPPTGKVKYSEEGVATQTEEDVICPGCGQIFPPKMHLQFLDHFEECQGKRDLNVNH